jgi:hypothetical protein
LPYIGVFRPYIALFGLNNVLVSLFLASKMFFIPGEKIGEVQDLSSKYLLITNHIHLEAYNDGRLIAPSNVHAMFFNINSLDYEFS